MDKNNKYRNLICRNPTIDIRYSFGQRIFESVLSDGNFLSFRLSLDCFVDIFNQLTFEF